MSFGDDTLDPANNDLISAKELLESRGWLVIEPLESMKKQLAIKEAIEKWKSSERSSDSLNELFKIIAELDE